MNKDRRKRITAITEQLEALKELFATQVAQLDGLNSEIELLQQEEQDAFDSLPEGLQQAARGQTMEQATESLGEAFEALGELISNVTDKLEEAVSALTQAVGD